MRVVRSEPAVLITIGLTLDILNIHPFHVLPLPMVLFVRIYVHDTFRAGIAQQKDIANKARTLFTLH